LSLTFQIEFDSSKSSTLDFSLFQLQNCLEHTLISKTYIQNYFVTEVANSKT